MSAAKKQQRIGAVVKTEFMLFLCELSTQLKWNYEISQMFCGTKVLFLKILTHGKILGTEYSHLGGEGKGPQRGRSVGLEDH